MESEDLSIKQPKNYLTNSLTDRKMDKKANNKKSKVYIFNFGQNVFITKNKEDILGWISVDIDEIDENGLQYKITTKLMTEDEIENFQSSYTK